MINTPIGPKTPEEALSLFITGTSNKGALLGILTQLHRLALTEANVASEHAIKFPAKYNDKIVRLAKEITTGRSIGAKSVTTVEDTLALLEKSYPAATVEITFKKDVTSKIPLLASLHPKLVRFNFDSEPMHLVSCVYISGGWGHIPRTYTVCITASKDELRTVAEAFVATLEKVEVKHNLIDRATVLSKQVMTAVIAERKKNGEIEVFYDETAFMATCLKLNRLSEFNDWTSKMSNKNAPINKIMEEAIPPMMCLNFFEEYIKQFEKMMLAPA